MVFFEKKAYLAILVILLTINGLYAASEHVIATGYDIEVTYSTIEETREALRAMESEEGQTIVTGVFNTTVSLYTTSYDEVRRMMVKRDAVKVTVRREGR